MENMASAVLLVWCILSMNVVAIKSYVTWYPSEPALERFLIDENYDLIYMAEVNMFHALSLANFSLNKMGFVNNTPTDADLTWCAQTFFKLPQLCQYNHYAFHISTLNVSLNRTVGLGTFNTSDTFVTCSSNYSSPSCQYRRRSDMVVMREVPGGRFAPYDIYNGTSSLLLTTGALLSGTPLDAQKNSFGLTLSTYPFNGIVGLSTVPDDDTWINRIPSPVFVSMYEIESYAYVFFWERGLESPRSNPAMYSRVARICKNDTGAMRSLLAGPSSVNAFTTFVKTRVTCSSSSGNMNDLLYYYDNLQSTFLVTSGSFDGSQTSQMHLYGIFTSPSFGPVGSAVCVFNYAAMASAFQTSNFLIRDPISLVFNPVAGARVDCASSQDSTPKLLSAVVTQSQGPRPIFSATGYTFRRIVVDQTTALDNVTYDVMFIAAVNGNQLLLLKMTYVAARGQNSAQYTSRVIPMGTSAEWVVQMSLSTSPRRPKAVYLATNSKLTVIPVDDCGAYTNCTDCVGARDPYCAFDSLTMTCVDVSSAPSRQNLLQDVVMGTTMKCPAPITTPPAAASTTTSTSATLPPCPVCVTCATTTPTIPTTQPNANITFGYVVTSGVNAREEQSSTNVAWIVISALLGFVVGVIIGIIMAAAIVNRRKFRLYDLCFPQSDDHGHEKGANGVSSVSHKDSSDGEERKHSRGNKNKICAVNPCSKEEEIEKNNNQVKVVPHHPPVLHQRYELQRPMMNGGPRHASSAVSMRDPNLKQNNAVQEPISNNEKERYRHNVLARANSVVESNGKVPLPSPANGGGISVSYTAGVGVHLPGAEVACSDC